MNDETMKNNADMRDEYDFGAGVRGKYLERYQEGTNLVLLAPDVASDFPDSESVNDALRQFKKDRKRVSKVAPSP